MKKIGILYLGRKGGPIVDTLELCKCFVAQGNNLVIYLSLQIENLEKFQKLESDYKDKVKLVLLHTYNNKYEFMLRTLNVFKFIKIANMIKKEQFDFVYLPMITLWGAIISLFCNGEKINSAVHDPESHLGEKNKIVDYLFYRCICHSKFITVFSTKFVPVVSKLYQKKESNICALKLGAYTYYRDKGTDRDNYQKQNRILFFGRIVEYKGLKYLLLAMKELLKYNPELKLRIAGNGKLSEEEQNLIKEIGTNIELHNEWIKDEDVESYFDSVDFVVLPYVEGSQSGVISLSYSMQIPVLATNVGGFDEQVNSKIGLLIEPKSVNALVNGILEMYNNDAFIQKGKQAEIYLKEELSWSVQAQRLINFMDQRL